MKNLKIQKIQNFKISKKLKIKKLKIKNKNTKNQ
jgi:hypothetical protein